MRAYLWTTAFLFGAVTVAHIARALTESMSFARDPVYVGLTVLAASLCVWAVRLIRTERRALPSPTPR